MRKKLLISFAAAVVLLIALGGVFSYFTMARVEGQYLDADGVRVHYTVEGEGEPLILIHGLAVHADLNWRRNGIIDALDDHFQVIAYDVRGHGLSDRPHDKDAYGDELVRDVGRLMDHLGIESAHIAGYSLGGFITLDFMAKHPDRVRSAVICAAGWHDPQSNVFLRPRKGRTRTLRNDGQAEAPNAKEEGTVSRVEPRPRKGGNTMLRNEEQPVTPKAKEDAMASRLLLAGFDFIKPLRDRLEHVMADPEALRMIRQSAPEMEGVSRELLAACTVPTLCIVGSEDGFVPYAEALAEIKPETDLVVLKGANHLTAVLESDLREGMLKFLLAHQNTAKPVV